MINKQAILAQLKANISAIEWQRETSITAYALGIREIDRALKHGGITAGCCHEIIYKESGPSLGFALHLLSSISQHKKPILWCSDQHDFYTPGFATYGIKDTDIIFVETKDNKESLWAAEQGLMCTDLSAVVIDAKKISLAEGRKLKLLAQKHNSTAILMIKKGARIDLPTIATTRWMITAVASKGQPSRNGIKIVGKPRFMISLLRNTHGLSQLSWTVEFDEHTLRFHTLPTLLSSTNQNYSEKIAIRPRERSA